MQMETPPGAEIILNGKKFLYFGGTGYYCLQGHPGLLKAAKAALMTYGTGPATGSSIPVGDSPVIRGLEKKVSTFFNTEAAVTFPSGYMSTAIGVSSLADQYDRIFIDENTHLSGLDGVRIVNKPIIRFKHLDHHDLEEKIEIHLKNGETPLLVSDGIFPALGVIAPADHYAAILKPYNGLMWLDDAHAVGVIGSNGRGTYDYYDLSSDRFYFGGTFSKAFGGFGGFIPGDEKFINHIKITSHVLRGASRIDAPSAAASCFGLDFLLNNSLTKERLEENSRYFKVGIQKLGIKIADTPQPITAFSLESSEKMEWVHKKLIKRRIVIQFINYIGGPTGGILRVVVFSNHTKVQIQHLLDTLEELILKYKS